MLGIIIVAYKNPERTADYINNQLTHLLNRHTVVVVNNASTMEECVALANKCGGVACGPDDMVGEHHVYIVHSQDNLGFAKGNNLGVKFLSRNCQFEYLLFSNDDIIISDRTDLKPMLELLDRKPNIGAIGPDIVGIDGHHQSPHRKVITAYRQIGWILFSKFRKQKKVKFHAPADEVPQEGMCYWVSGAFFLMKSSQFSAVNGFDPDTFLYLEEPILAERLKLLGKSMYFYPNIKILHLEGGTTKKTYNKDKRKNIVVDSNCIYFRKYLKTPRFIISLYRIISNVKG